MSRGDEMEEPREHEDEVKLLEERAEDPEPEAGDVEGRGSGGKYSNIVPLAGRGDLYVRSERKAGMEDA